MVALLVPDMYETRRERREGKRACLPDDEARKSLVSRGTHERLRETIPPKNGGAPKAEP